MSTRGWQDVTMADVQRMQRKATSMPTLKRAKYGNQKTVVDGLTFDSKKEAQRWQVLRALGRAGQIRNLARQLPFSLHVGVILIGTYTPDFVYEERVGEDWLQRVDDVKSPATKRDKLYRWKTKHFTAQYGITIREV